MLLPTQKKLACLHIQSSNFASVFLYYENQERAKKTEKIPLDCLLDAKKAQISTAILYLLFDGRVKLTETVVGAEKVIPLILVKLTLQ